jgi:hypothetical protein
VWHAGTVEQRTVVAAWEPADRPPLVLRPGDRVRVGEVSEEWPAFVWCERPGDTGGWVLAEVLGPVIDGTASAVAPYSSAELAVRPGEVVTSHHRGGGWCWCTRGSDSGWLPERVLQ